MVCCETVLIYDSDIKQLGEYSPTLFFHLSEVYFCAGCNSISMPSGEIWKNEDNLNPYIPYTMSCDPPLTLLPYCFQCLFFHFQTRVRCCFTG
jgi:hypothetical protein